APTAPAAPVPAGELERADLAAPGSPAAPTRVLGDLLPAAADLDEAAGIPTARTAPPGHEMPFGIPRDAPPAPTARTGACHDLLLARRAGGFGTTPPSGDRPPGVCEHECSDHF